MSLGGATSLLFLALLGATARPCWWHRHGRGRLIFWGAAGDADHGAGVGALLGAVA